VIEDEITRRLNSDFKCQFLLRSVARRRLVETENPCACVTVNCNLCESVIMLSQLQLREIVTEVPIIQSSELEPVIIVTRTLLHVTI
jgi:hypothetical protein